MGSHGDQFHIIIVGGGIAGLVAAIALRAPRRHITVLERSRMLHEVGALISLQPNASKIVTKLGLDPFLATASPLVDRGFRMFDQAGHVVRELPLDTARFGADRVLYHRQDLHAALRDAAVSDSGVLPGAPVEIRTAAAVVSCRPEDGVVVLADGTRLQGDLVVGADGIKSVVRSSVLGAQAAQYPPIPTGLSAYRVLMPRSLLDEVAGLPPSVTVSDPAITSMVVGGDRRVIMGPGRGGALYGLVALVPDSGGAKDASASEDKKEDNDSSWVRAGSKAELKAAFAGFAPWLMDLFEAASDDDIGLWQLRDLDPLPRWTRGRVVLIGDAAHAMLPTQGQGASQSVEDAEALAAFLAEVGPRPTKPTEQEISNVLQKVWEARYDRVSLIQAYSRQQAKPATESGSQKVTLDPGQFLQFNCDYDGAVDWLKRRRAA
ncbi:uncharacterized protein SPSK_02511 [Sporothrix schenckii 1099-18]|uniref:FAD-binding domain-containing protein n=1 Tax=Sporothrix schenckii 1099-18 TaxID=1397361 RepID=A0A0F2M9D4_SPOSC|nr:uncharacterized protein SPSK_02511 [Sporothrix schenckii 1099-18]KJR86252.1 hypothetical protein SPSK_02511 [Sporothrix schenckii 1099-18]